MRDSPLSKQNSIVAFVRFIYSIYVDRAARPHTRMWAREPSETPDTVRVCPLCGLRVRSPLSGDD